MAGADVAVACARKVAPMGTGWTGDEAPASITGEGNDGEAEDAAGGAGDEDDEDDKDDGDD